MDGVTETMQDDLKAALRSLRSSKGLTFAALIVLTLGIGATRRHVIGMVLLNAGALVTAGIAIGAVAAWYVSAASKAFLFRLQPTDPRAFAAAAASLLVAALVASTIPARRAASVDPMVALRAE
jgi:putative ABC transport system permease protein